MLRFSDELFDKSTDKEKAQCLCVPLRSRSARIFIGPELSTHTISFKVSPQHECDALQEKHAEFIHVNQTEALLMSQQFCKLTTQLFPTQNQNPGETEGQRRDLASESGSKKL